MSSFPVTTEPSVLRVAYAGRVLSEIKVGRYFYRP